MLKLLIYHVTLMFTQALLSEIQNRVNIGCRVIHWSSLFKVALRNRKKINKPYFFLLKPNLLSYYNSMLLLLFFQ